jgi:hypothetical protein
MAPDIPDNPDVDGDLVPNEIDNCPALANSNQHNEDGDKFGDPCDACPVDDNDVPLDPDGDGVAAPCDPNPDTKGDVIALFQGFDSGIPAGWSSTGTWTAAGDAVRVVDPTSTGYYLVVPEPYRDRMTMSAGVIVEQLSGFDDSAVSICNPFQTSNSSRICCELYRSSGGSRDLSLYDSIAQYQLGNAANTWTTNTPYRLQLAHAGTSYTCSIDGATTFSGDSTGTVTNPTFAVHTFEVTARVQWVMLVASP